MSGRYQQSSSAGSDRYARGGASDSSTRSGGSGSRGGYDSYDSSRSRSQQRSMPQADSGYFAGSNSSSSSEYQRSSSGRRGYTDDNNGGDRYRNNDRYQQDSRSSSSRNTPGAYDDNHYGAPPPRERRRHERQDEGYFYSKEDEEDAYQETFQEIQRVKGESVNSTRNALRRVREAEEVGTKSLRQLNEQSEQLAKAEGQILQAEYHAASAEVKTQNLEKLNRNFIVATISSAFSNPFNKAKRREKELAEKIETEKQLAANKENARKDARSTQQRNEAAISGGRVPGSAGASSRRDDGPFRSRTNRLDEEENCEMENEIDSNLGEISSGLGRLKMLAMAQQDTINTQNNQLGRMDRSADDVHDRVRRTDGKLKRIANS
ncbi:Protein transport protein S9 plasma membrane t-SNARE [Sorochytrium milnesiophthora]